MTSSNPASTGYAAAIAPSTARKRRPATHVAALVLSMLFTGSGLPGAVAASMPAPEAYAAPTASETLAGQSQDVLSYQLSRTTMRLRAGTYNFFRFSDAGVQRARRTVRFATAVRFRAAAQPVKIGDQMFTRITGGLWYSWYVPTPAAAPTSVTKFATPKVVTLAATSYAGLRFYNNRRITTRRIATLSTRLDVHATKRATFNGRGFLYMSDGPLADRWVLASSVSTTSSGSGSITPPPTTTVGTATWKTIVLVYRETDVTYRRADGSNYRLQARMSDSMYNTATNAISRTVTAVNGWSGGLARWNMKFVDVPHAVTKVEPLASGYWLGTDSLVADIDRYAPAGTYDSIVVVWPTKDSKGVMIPVPGWGLTLPPGPWANGAGFSSVQMGEGWWWNQPYPEEVFIHEWMHQVLFFHEYAGRLKFDLHASADFGYTPVNGSWKGWLSDVMQGRVDIGSTYSGVSPRLWQIGTPLNP